MRGPDRSDLLGHSADIWTAARPATGPDRMEVMRKAIVLWNQTFFNSPACSIRLHRVWWSKQPTSFPLTLFTMTDLNRLQVRLERTISAINGHDSTEAET